MGTRSSNEQLVDITAKMDDAGDTLSLYIVNLSDKPQDAVINIDNFKHKGKATVWTIGDCDLNQANTDENMYNVVSKTYQKKMSDKDIKHT